MPRGISQPPPIRKGGMGGGGMQPWMFVLGAAALGGLWYFHSKATSGNSSDNSSNSSAPTLDSVLASQQNTDITSGLPVQDTWPYNQLALPYNFTGSNDNQVLSNNSALNPQDTSFVGYQMTPTGAMATNGSA